MEAVSCMSCEPGTQLTECRTTSVQSLNEEIQKVGMEEEDDKAMGRFPSAEQVAENAEVRFTLANLAMH